MPSMFTSPLQIFTFFTRAGGGLFGIGYAMYYGLQATGMEPGYAGNWVQLIMVMFLCVGWVSTYVFRVATKVRTWVARCVRKGKAGDMGST